MSLSSTVRAMCAVFGLGGCLALAGCGDVIGNSGPLLGPLLSGVVFGGQQPIVGAQLSLYAAGTSVYGAGATSLLSGTVTSDATGTFNIAGLYTCPSASAQVYLISTGGNAGSGVNPKAVLMSALGSCGNLGTTSFVTLNEVSTVAAVYSLAQFMTPGSTAVGTSSTNAIGLQNAFATASNLVDNSDGTARATTPAGNGKISQRTLNTLANIIASCVNTTGSTGACSQLFSAATPPGGTAPADTLAAILNIALNPGLNVTALYDLPPAKASFQPSLTSIPNDFTLSIEYSGGGVSSGQLLQVDAAGNVWVPNATDPGTISEFSPTGVAISGAGGFTGGGLSYPESLAIDLSGNVWSANEGNGTVSEHTAGGTALSGSGFIVTGMLYPYDIAIDGTGNVFTANGNNTVSKLSPAGASLGLFTGGGMDVPYALAIDSSENVWVANSDLSLQPNSITKFSNTGTPATLTAYTGGGLNIPVALAIDAAGNVWAANFEAPSISKFSSTGVPLSGSGYTTPNNTSKLVVDGSNTVWTANVDGSISRFANSGTAISPATGYVSPDATAVVGIAVDPSGNVWTTDYYVNSVFEFVGAAGPTITPLAQQVKNQTFGTRP
jgi:streptogramin lyase